MGVAEDGRRSSAILHQQCHVCYALFLTNPDSISSFRFPFPRTPHLTLSSFLRFTLLIVLEVYFLPSIHTHYNLLSLLFDRRQPDNALFPSYSRRLWQRSKSRLEL
jgi:hypothetical protein